MKIAMFSWETLHSQAVGGVAAHVTELAAGLERRGHEVHVFTRPGYGSGGVNRIDGVWYHYCPHALKRDLVDETQEMCRSFVWHFQQTEGHIGRFDVVHAHDWLASNAMVWIKQGRPDQRAMLTMHSTEYGRCGNQFWNGSSARIRDHERNGSYCADRVIAVSAALKGELAWMYNLPDWKCSVVYNGVTIRKFDGFIDSGAVKARYGIGPMDPMVLFSGRLAVQKGADLLLEAVPGLLRHYPHAKFVFVGEGHMRQGLQARAQDLRVAQATRFLGYRNGHELPELYKACDVVCVPSRNEPFGIIILEAWAAGKPVVASQNGGPNELIWHTVTGLKIYPHPDSVGWGLGTLFTNFDWARWMSYHGGVKQWVADLNRVYRTELALHELDFAPEGFEWVDYRDARNSTLSFIRKARSTGDLVLVVLNFTPVGRQDYRIGVPCGGYWQEILNSDAREYGGSGQGNAGGLEAEAVGWHGRWFSLRLTLPPLAALFLVLRRPPTADENHREIQADNP